MEISKNVLNIATTQIASLMKQFRENETRLTQEDVAKRMGTTRAYVSMLESGKINFSFAIFFKYCIAVGAKPTFQLLNSQKWIELSKNATSKGLYIDEE